MHLTNLILSLLPFLDAVAEAHPAAKAAAKPQKDRRGFITDIFRGRYHTWPRPPLGVTIPYCYADEESAVHLGSTMEAAVGKWHDALGDGGQSNSGTTVGANLTDPASMADAASMTITASMTEAASPTDTASPTFTDPANPTDLANLTFTAYSDLPVRFLDIDVPGTADAERKFCKVLNNQNASSWNTAVPEGALQLKYQAGDWGTTSHIGFIAPSDLGGLEPDRHEITFDCDVYKNNQPPKQDAISALTHELGHVLGLANENQRPNAFSEVTFTCENLALYTQTKLHLPTAITIEEACSDAVVSKSVRLGAEDFLTIDDGGLTVEGGFDRDSVMMVGSWYRASGEDRFPLVWKDGSVIEGPFEISVGDVAAVGVLYTRN